MLSDLRRQTRLASLSFLRSFVSSFLFFSFCLSCREGNQQNLVVAIAPPSSGREGKETMSRIFSFLPSLPSWRERRSTWKRSNHSSGGEGNCGSSASPNPNPNPNPKINPKGREFFLKEEEEEKVARKHEGKFNVRRRRRRRYTIKIFGSRVICPIAPPRGAIPLAHQHVPRPYPYTQPTIPHMQIHNITYIHIMHACINIHTYMDNMHT